MKNTQLENILKKIRDSINNDYELEYYYFHKYRYQFILDKITKLPLAPNARILDVGCYPLHLFHALTWLNFSMYGISSPHEPVKIPHVVVLNIEVDPLPFAASFFDLIIFSETMEHLVVNPLLYLTKLRRILAPRGSLLITTPNAAGLHKLVPILMGRSTYFPLSDLLSTRPDDGSIYHRHNREYTSAELTYVLEKAEFSVKTREYFNGYRSYEHKIASGKLGKQIIRMATYWLTKLYPRWRDSLYAEATPQKNQSK